MKKTEELRIGYMPLAHDVYWHYFPQHFDEAMRLADEYEAYLTKFGKIVKTGKLIDCPERSKEARILFQKEDVEVIVLATVTYSTPDDVALDLQDYPRPTIIWNTQKSPCIDKDINFDGWMFEHGITGVPGLTNILYRCEIPYFLVSGTIGFKGVEESFKSIMCAMEAKRKVWGSKIGVFGHLYPGMIDFGYDATQMYSKFGATTVPVLATDVTNAFNSVPDEKVLELQREMVKKYPPKHDFKDEELFRSMKLAIAMLDIAEEKGLDAASVLCQSMWQDEQIGVVSCIGNSLLLEKGVFVTCEGDVPTALAGMIMHTFTDRAFFSEIWCNDFEIDQFIMGHSGQMNMKVFEGKYSPDSGLVRHPWWHGCKGHGACFDLRMPTGEITFVSINAAPDGTWRIVGTNAEVVDRNPTKLGAPHFFVKFKDKDIGTFIEEWGNAGAAHHVAVAYGNKMTELKAYAKIMNVDFISI